MTDDELTLEGFLRVMPALDTEQLMAISAAYQHAGRDALERARAAAGAVARADGALEELQQLQATIIQWAASQLSPSRLYTGEGLGDNRILYELREQARPALLDAATALFLEARLTDADREALLGPVDSVIG